MCASLQEPATGAGPARLQWTLGPQPGLAQLNLGDGKGQLELADSGGAMQEHRVRIALRQNLLKGLLEPREDHLAAAACHRTASKARSICC